jgi:hypothetical protein
MASISFWVNGSVGGSGNDGRFDASGRILNDPFVRLAEPKERPEPFQLFHGGDGAVSPALPEESHLFSVEGFEGNQVVSRGERLYLPLE